MAAVAANSASLLFSTDASRRNYPCRSTMASKLAFLAPPMHQNLILRAVSVPTRRSLHCVKVAVSDPQESMNGSKDNGILDDQLDEKIGLKDFPDMKTLIIAYKKAIMDGDGKSVEAIEEAICKVDSEKNSLALSLEEMIAEIASGKDKLIRVKADFENFRKKTDNDRRTFTSDIQSDLLESLLPMVDSFERTRKEVIPETEKEKKIETSYQGIYKQFVEVMRSLDVAVVETVGKPFDPSSHRCFIKDFAEVYTKKSNTKRKIHEAVAREECQHYKAGIVSQEICRGFVQGKRVLRAAKVKVSTGSVQVNSAPTNNSAEKQEVPDESINNVEPITSDS